MGSLMNLFWDQRRAVTPVQLGDAVLLAQAHVACIGGKRDEMIVDEVVHILRETTRYKVKPVTNKKGVARSACTHNVLEEMEQRLHESGRICEDLSSIGTSDILHPELVWDITSAADRRKFLAERSRSSRPTDLPDVIVQSLRKSKDVSGLVKPVPVDVRHLHADQRGAAKSVLREKVADWLAKEPGPVWQQERGLLLRADDDQAEGRTEQAGCLAGEVGSSIPSSSATKKPGAPSRTAKRRKRS